MIVGVKMIKVGRVLHFYLYRELILIQVSAPVILIISHISAYQHGKFKGQSILEGAQIQTEFFLDLFKTVYQSVSVDIKLSGGFRKIQIIFKECADDGQGFTVQGIQRFVSKNLLDEHFAQGHRKLVDQSSDS